MCLCKVDLLKNTLLLGENGYMYMYDWVPSCSHENVTVLLTGYNPTQNKKQGKETFYCNFINFIPLKTFIK